VISDRLKRALDYPYPAPKPPWIFSDHRVFTPGDPLFQKVFQDIGSQARHAVVAAGSNRAPDQLRRKFEPQDIVPVSMVTLRDVDTVYSAHFSAYGSVPATLTEAAGLSLRSAVLWLTDEQLERMNETEALGVNYRLGWIDRPALSRRFGLRSPRTGAYISLHGALTDDDGSAVPLAGFTVRGRKRRGLTQQEVQKLVSARLHPGSVMEDFIGMTIDNTDERNRRRDTLKKTAILPDETFWP
tara:strand:+ start:51284 stop:52009 length:726 start_codon:yes stop_codon:yes gene_type:complete